MHPFDVEHLTTSQWRNGGGATREIVAWPVGDEEFQWRASVADIDRDGPFSAFPGVDRTFTLVAGDGVRLTAPGTFDRTARVGEPLAFSGDLELTAERRGGACRVLNIMVRRGRRAARVDRITGPLVPPGGHAGVFYVLRGHWRTDAAGRPLTAGQGVWWDEPDGAPDGAPGREAATPLSPDAVGLWADIAPVR
ncbi:HutD/Ves family protein [Streptomyces roseoviridis]|uniref:HutD family protein n=1 Tax=Streptomyces roseoviridis TaxID=67361 RepID=A0ABV5QUM5_9ACTN